LHYHICTVIVIAILWCDVPNYTRNITKAFKVGGKSVHQAFHRKQLFIKHGMFNC
jgi:hypothetical protein